MTTPSNPSCGAPLWRRFAALGYDSLILLAISMAYGAVVTIVGATLGLGSQQGAEQYQPMFATGGIGELVLIGWILTLGSFYVGFWQRSGQTVGMRAWRLCLIDVHTQQPPSAVRCSQRAAWGVLSLLLAGIGYWYRFFSPTGQCLHDKLTTTTVIVLPKNKPG
ncbi:RDD family protein [Marinagarivorans algicola]|uniref:RDD family protein n=1 Tax=Marinagarivorans algicola TaxID=1513270 RepID=UPI00373642FF